MILPSRYNGAYGEVSWLDAILSAVPAVLAIANPQQAAPVVVQPQSNIPMIIGVGLGGILLIGAVMMAARR